jgi:hypothetical protein
LPTFDRFGLFSQAFSERVLNARFLISNSDTAVSRDNCRHRIAKLQRNRSDKSATVKLRDTFTLVVSSAENIGIWPDLGDFPSRNVAARICVFRDAAGCNFRVYFCFLTGEV